MAHTPREKGHGAVSGKVRDRIGDEHQERIRRKGDRSRDPKGDRSRDSKLEGQPVRRS